MKLVNSFHNRLQFTYETENNSQINFLDIMVIKNNDGTLIFDLYRKPMKKKHSKVQAIRKCCMYCGTRFYKFAI